MSLEHAKGSICNHCNILTNFCLFPNWLSVLYWNYIFVTCHFVTNLFTNFRIRAEMIKMHLNYLGIIWFLPGNIYFNTPSPGEVHHNSWGKIEKLHHRTYGLILPDNLLRIISSIICLNRFRFSTSASWYSRSSNLKF